MPDTDSPNDDEQVRSAAAIQSGDSDGPGSADRDATPIDGARPSSPPTGSAAAMTTGLPAQPPPLVSWQMPAPSSVRPTDRTGAPIRLWRPVDVAVVSFLIGFPAGLGLAARNAWRLGRRRRAWVQLAGGSVGLLAVVLTVRQRDRHSRRPQHRACDLRLRPDQVRCRDSATDWSPGGAGRRGEWLRDRPRGVGPRARRGVRHAHPPRARRWACHAARQRRDRLLVPARRVCHAWRDRDEPDAGRRSVGLEPCCVCIGPTEWRPRSRGDASRDRQRPDDSRTSRTGAATCSRVRSGLRMPT